MNQSSWTNDEIRQKITGEKRDMQLFMKILTQPQLFTKNIRQALEEQDGVLLANLMQANVLPTLYETAFPGKNVLQDLLTKHPLHLLEKVLEAWRPETDQEILALQKDIRRYQSTHPQMSFRKLDILWHCYALLNEKSEFLRGKLKDKSDMAYLFGADRAGALPPIELGGFEVDYVRFSGLMASDLRQKDPVSVLTQVIEDEPKRLHWTSEKRKEIERKSNEATSSEELEKHTMLLMKMENLSVIKENLKGPYAVAVQKIPAFIDIYERFMNGPEKPLLVSFIQKGGIFLLSADKEQRADGISHGNQVTLHSVTSGIFLHELIHEVERPHLVLSNTPVMAQVCRYFQYHADQHKEGRETEYQDFYQLITRVRRLYKEEDCFQRETMAYLGSAKEKQMKLPPVARSVLKFVLAYADALCRQDDKEVRRLETALNRKTIQASRSGTQLVCYLEDTLHHQKRPLSCYHVTDKTDLLPRPQLLPEEKLMQLLFGSRDKRK